MSKAWGMRSFFHLQPRRGWGGKTLSYPKTHLFSKGTTTTVVIQEYKCKHNAVKPVLAAQIVALECAVPLNLKSEKQLFCRTLLSNYFDEILDQDT